MHTLDHICTAFDLGLDGAFVDASDSISYYTVCLEYSNYMIGPRTHIFSEIEITEIGKGGNIRYAGEISYGGFHYRRLYCSYEMVFATSFQVRSYSITCYIHIHIPTSPIR